MFFHPYRKEENHLITFENLTVFTIGATVGVIGIPLLWNFLLSLFALISTAIG